MIYSGHLFYVYLQGRRLARFFGRQGKTSNHNDANGSSHENHQQRLLAEGTTETRFRSNVYKNDKESTVIELERNNNDDGAGKSTKSEPAAPIKPPNDGTSYATCDVISRFLFPCGYIIFNVGYWVAYMTQQKEFDPMA